MTCSIVDCPKAAVCRGWCTKHYQRWRKYGDPNIGKNPTGRRRATRCVNGHDLTTDNVYVAKNGKRQCRTCSRHRSKLHNRRRRAEGRAAPKPAEWHRQYRAEIKAGKRIVTPRPRQKATSARLRILDLLCIEGEWCQADEIAERLGLKTDSFKRISYRLEADGLIERRIDPLRFKATAAAVAQVA